MLYIINGQVVLPGKIITRAGLVVKGKKIVAITGKQAPPRGAVKIDARGNFIAPGFIDLHIHGDAELVSCQQVKGGTTHFLATLHPAQPAALLKNIARTLRLKGRVAGAKVLGLRLEGPFINRTFCGALAPGTLRAPDLAEAKRIIRQAKAALKMVVLAPELTGAVKLIGLLRRHKIIASLGHSGATYQQALKGINAGITHATHTFNRMAGFDHRAGGALAAVLTEDRVACEVICDGIHVHPAALRILNSCKSADKIILITDSTQAQDAPLKKRCGDVFKLRNGTLYGTALTLNKALRNAVKFLGLSLPQAVKLVTLNPAKALKIDRYKGSIAVGKHADLVIFDQNFDVQMTIVEGKVAYDNR
ncbi:N-acetylglucosamine-6-phosphate deacetylase [Candidatus Omnitrophota bacterium]